MHGGYEDWEFWLRLASLGRRGAVIQEPLFNHRRHGHTMTHDAHAKRAGWIARIAEYNSVFFADAGHRRRLAALAPLPQEGEVFEALGRAVAKGRPTDRPGLIAVAPWLPLGGGAEMLLFKVLRHLAQTHRVAIVTTLPSSNDMASMFRAFTDEIYHLPAMLAQPHWRPFVLSLVRSRGIATVLSSGSAWFYEEVGELKKAVPGLRVIDILHNDLPLGHMKSVVAAGGAIDAEVAVSAKIARSLKAAGVPEDRIRVIANGVDMAERFRPDRVSGQEARRLLGLRPDGFLAVFVGRLSPEKRPLAFLDVLEALGSSGADVRGLLVGDGALRGEVEARLRALPPDLLAWMAHLPPERMNDVFAAADVLVLTSTIEGMPFVVIEALASGCPVAATDVGDISSIVREGVNGFLVEPSRPEDLADRIGRLLADRDLARRMGEAAVASVRAAGLAEEAMLAAYRALVEAKPGEAGARAR